MGNEIMSLYFFTLILQFHSIFTSKINLVTMGELFLDKRSILDTSEHPDATDVYHPFETLVREYYCQNHVSIKRVFDGHHDLIRKFISPDQLISSIFFLKNLIPSRSFYNGNQNEENSQKYPQEQDESNNILCEPSRLEFQHLRLFLKNIFSRSSLSEATSLETNNAFQEYQHELNELKKAAGYLSKLELYDLRLALYFHSIICYDNDPSISLWLKNTLDDVINTIDYFFQLKYCPGISTLGIYDIPFLIWNITMNMSIEYPGRNLPYHQLKAKEPYFFPLFKRFFPGEETRMNSAQITFDIFLADVSLYSAALMVNDWLYPVENILGFESYHPLLKKLVKSRCLGPFPFISSKQEEINDSILVKSFFTHFSQIRIHLLMHQRRKTTLNLDPTVDEIITKILYFAHSFLKDISNLFVRAGLMLNTSASTYCLP